MIDSAFYKKAVDFMTDTELDKKIYNSTCILVAYSGGADSTVLLHFLYEYLKNTNIKLAAAHLNHMIRGEEAVRDREFCRTTVEALNIPFYTKDTDIPQIAKESGLGTEECARIERYKFLNEVASSLGKDALIATAHNSTDNMETVLFNLIRGSGTSGMEGIAPCRDNIIRPLLSNTSDEIRNFATEMRLEYVTDSTNNETVYTRNFIRKNIIPLTRQINPQAEDAVLRLNKIARSESDFILAEAKKLTEKGYINIKDYKNCHQAVKKRSIALLYALKNGSQNGLSMTHINAAYELCEKGNGMISFPNCTLYCDIDRIYFRAKEEDANDGIPACYEISLYPDGIAVPFGEHFAVALCAKDKTPVFDENIYNLFIQQPACFGTINRGVYVRCRKAGDKLLCGGKHKKLKKLLCDSKIPLRIRNSLPIFCDECGILWVPTVAVRDNTAGKTNDYIMYLFALKENCLL